MRPPLLSVRDLHVRFQTQGQLLHAVRGVDLDLHRQETVGIVGESGCGKSATAKALLQLHAPHTTQLTGEITYKDKKLLAFSERQMRAIRGKEISMIFQDPMTSLNPTLSVGKQITEGYLRHYPQSSFSEAKKVALEALDQVGISHPQECFRAYPHLLSGGMRQRAMIALALCCRPSILLADEPTTALDVTIQMQILDLLQTLQRQNQLSILLITHDLSVIAKMCDRVLVMYGGKVVESAPVDRLFASPQHPYTQRLLLSIPRLDQDKNAPLHPIEGTPPNLSHPLPGCSFCARCPEAMKICAQNSPPPFSVAPDHWSACFHHDPRKKS